MRLLSLDPSFRGLAYSIIDTENKELFISYDGENLGSTVDFTRSYQIGDVLTSRVVKEIRNMYQNFDYIISETPPPNNLYSSGLFALDALLLFKCRVAFKPKEIYSVSASFLSHIHGTNRYTKKDSISLARHFIELLERELNYNVELEYRLTDDMAESFLFLLKCWCIADENVRTIIYNELNSFSGEYYKVVFPFKLEEEE